MIPAHVCLTAKVWTDRAWPLPLLCCRKLRDSWNSLQAYKSLSVQIRCSVQESPTFRLSEWKSLCLYIYCAHTLQKIYRNHRIETFKLWPNTFNINIWYLTHEAHSFNSVFPNLTGICCSRGVEFPDFAVTRWNTRTLAFLPPAFFCLHWFIKQCKLVAIFHICSLCVILKKQRSSDVWTKWM